MPTSASQVGAFPASLISDPQLSLPSTAQALATVPPPIVDVDDVSSDGLLRVVPYARYGDCAEWLPASAPTRCALAAT